MGGGGEVIIQVYRFSAVFYHFSQVYSAAEVLAFLGIVESVMLAECNYHCNNVLFTTYPYQ